MSTEMEAYLLFLPCVQLLHDIRGSSGRPLSSKVELGTATRVVQPRETAFSEDERLRV